MMTDQEFKRRVNSITKALNTDNIRCLSIADCQWLINNYWLRPDNYWSLTTPVRRFSRKQFEEFYSTFNLLEWIVSEVDLGHALTWILHWIEKKQGSSENVKDALEQFKQRCKLVHAVRNNVGMKTYNIHYLYSGHIYKRRDSFNVFNKFQNLVMPMYGRSVNEVIKKFLAQMRPSDTDMRRFKIRRVRQASDRALYFIRQDPRMSASVFQFLTDDSTTFNDPSFHWHQYGA